MHLLSSSSRTLLLLLTTLTLPTAHASSSSSNTTTEPLLLANLTYGNFLGSYSPEYNITYWQKIPYAAPPVGPLRFRAPQPPLPENSNGSTTIYNSTQPYDLCPQRTVNGSEDCLYLGLYSRPWTPSSCSSSSTPLRPVVVTFHGGAFIQGGGSFTLPPSAFPILNVSSSSSSSSSSEEDAVGKEFSPDIIFIYPNYRLNAFGFLPGKEISEDPESDLNVGLLDQRAVLQWVRDYIEVFGGDKEQVTVWGQSAGGGSVIAQVLGNGASTVEEEENEKEGKRREKLFQRALAGSPFWPKTYHYDAPEAQELYDRFAELAGCGKNGSTTTTTTTTTSLQCLKQAPVQTLREASLAVSASHTYNTSSYSWAPVIDKKFLLKPLSSASPSSSSPNLQLNVDVAWSMYNLHEGENFLPQGLSNSTGDSYGFNSSLASFNQWLQGYLPYLTEIELTQVKEELYPEVGLAEELVGGYNTSYTRAGLIYRDTVLTCPGLWMVEASGGGGGEGGGQGAYLGEYTIDPAKHGSDTGYVSSLSCLICLLWKTTLGTEKKEPKRDTNSILHSGIESTISNRRID